MGLPTPSDIYLYNGKTITIGGALNHTQKIGVTMRNPDVFTSGWSTYMDGETPADYFTSENTGYYVVPEGGEVKLVRPYTVTFHPNGGDGTMKNQEFFDGEVKALTANTFTRTGYTFSGWNTQADGSGTSYGNGEDLTLTNDLPLYAQWKAIPYNDNSLAIPATPPTPSHRLSASPAARLQFPRAMRKMETP